MERGFEEYESKINESLNALAACQDSGAAD